MHELSEESAMLGHVMDYRASVTPAPAGTTPADLWDDLRRRADQIRDLWESDPEAALYVAMDIDKTAGYLIYEAVKRAREAGVTWEGIAMATGQSRPAAWRRWTSKGID